MKVVFQTLAGFMLFLSGIHAQHYQAMNGSAYAGSLGIANNPASIVFTPYAWDITLFALQYKTTTNAFTVKKFPLFNIDTSGYLMKNGSSNRHLTGHFDLHLLNTRISFNSRHAIAFGANLRGYLRGNTSPFHFQDTITEFKSFLAQNDGLRGANGKIMNSTWLEAFGAYGFTIWNREKDRLQAGITLKANKGLAGGYVLYDQIQISPDDNSMNDFEIGQGNVEFGYAATVDDWSTDDANMDNLRKVLKGSQNSFALDVGVEYVIKTQEITDVFDEETDYNYTWKLGLALLDIGWNEYRYSENSRLVANARPGVNSVKLENTFDGISTFPVFNDSLATLVQQSTPLRGTFRVLHPARMVLNADKYLQGNFFVNGELTINMASLAGKERLYVSDMNFLTITPRWETRRWGVYLPFQFNRQGQFMLGTAFKAGPLLLGFHNLGNLFGRNRNLNGGGYLALVIRSGKGTVSERNRGIDCPVIRY